MSEISRRELFRRGGVIAVGLVTPSWLSSIARADILQRAQGGKAPADTVLVVCQLSGGNDGLNTIVPWSQSRYYELRRQLAIREPDVLKLDESLGFHPSLAGLKTLYDERKVAIVQQAGYPNQSRSHFQSMDVWQSASPDGKLPHGWVGRHFDAQARTGPLNPVVAIGLSTEKPRALSAQNASIPCFASLTDIQSMVGDPDVERMLRQIQGPDAAAGTNERVVQQAGRSALDAMASLRDKLAAFDPKENYPQDRFGQGFKQIAQLIVTSPATRVIYFANGGFDTHANQADQHARLLKGFGDALLAFDREMTAAGRADNVVVLVFSEFGRRSYENGSAGTDHGAAGPMFVVGKSVKGGLYGPRPDLSALRDGDLPFAIDFRQVYATALDRWLGGDSGVVLGRPFDHVPFV